LSGGVALPRGAPVRTGLVRHALFVGIEFSDCRQYAVFMPTFLY
jgi:hypothetical protein